MTDVTVTVEMHGNGREIAPAWKHTVDGELDSGDHASWTDFDAFAPPIDYLAGLNESHPGTITLTVNKPWVDPVEFAVPARIRDHNEWFNASFRLTLGLRFDCIIQLPYLL